MGSARWFLNVGLYAERSQHLNPKNLELLETVSEHEPESIREAAKLVDRDDKQVHRTERECHHTSTVIETVPVDE